MSRRPRKRTCAFMTVCPCRTRWMRHACRLAAGAVGVSSCIPCSLSGRARTVRRPPSVRTYTRCSPSTPALLAVVKLKHPTPPSGGRPSLPHPCGVGRRGRRSVGGGTPFLLLRPRRSELVPPLDPADPEAQGQAGGGAHGARSGRSGRPSGDGEHTRHEPRAQAAL